jgi:osmoprotectant transport system substrate-binding protein
VPGTDERALRWTWVARRLALVLAATTAACSSLPPTESAPAEGIVVASFNFDESRLLAEIYAQALEDEGVTVRRELDLGPRELVLPAMRQGLVDVVPEYVGTLLDSVAPDGDRVDLASATAALDRALAPLGLDVLEPSSASNQNAVVVTRELATDGGLAAVSDLRPLAADLTLGGPPECPTRERCLVGLESTYSLQFAEFVAFDGSRLVRQALLDGVIDVGILFTTDGYLAGDDLVVLADDRGLQPVENLVPLVRPAALSDPRAVTALDEVAAALTTAELRFLNWRVSVRGGTPASEARGWLIRQGLVARER